MPQTSEARSQGPKKRVIQLVSNLWMILKLHAVASVCLCTSSTNLTLSCFNLSLLFLFSVSSLANNIDNLLILSSLRFEFFSCALSTGVPLLDDRFKYLGLLLEELLLVVTGGAGQGFWSRGDSCSLGVLTPLEFPELKEQSCTEESKPKAGVPKKVKLQPFKILFFLKKEMLIFEAYLDRVTNEKTTLASQERQRNLFNN